MDAHQEPSAPPAPARFCWGNTISATDKLTSASPLSSHHRKHCWFPWPGTERAEPLLCPLSGLSRPFHQPRQTAHYPRWKGQRSTVQCVSTRPGDVGRAPQRPLHHRRSQPASNMQLEFQLLKSEPNLTSLLIRPLPLLVSPPSLHLAIIFVDALAALHSF